MPRKDPITGCMVMTMGEFWADEAKREDKTPGEVMEEYFAQVEEANREYSQRLRVNALTFLQEGAKMELEAWLDSLEYAIGSEPEYITRKVGNGWRTLPEPRKGPGPCPPMPVKVLLVVLAESDGYFRSSGQKVQALCLADDGWTYEMTRTSTYFSGSFYEPPDGEDTFEWKEI